MGSTGTSRIASTSTVSYDTPEHIAEVKKIINSISAGKRWQEIKVARTYDGHELSMSIEKVKTRDYWGKPTGQTTYTMNVYDNTDKDAGLAGKIWYNYGMDIKRVKAEARRLAGVDRR